MLDFGLSFNEDDYRELLRSKVLPVGSLLPVGEFPPTLDVYIHPSTEGLPPSLEADVKSEEVIKIAVNSKCCISHVIMDASYTKGVLRVHMCTRANFEGGIEASQCYQVEADLKIPSFDTSYKDVKVGRVPNFAVIDLSQDLHALLHKCDCGVECVVRIPFDPEKFSVLEDGSPVSPDAMLSVAYNSRVTVGLLSSTYWPIILNFLMAKGLSLSESKYFL